MVFFSFLLCFRSRPTKSLDYTPGPWNPQRKRKKERKKVERSATRTTPPTRQSMKTTTTSNQALFFSIYIAARSAASGSTVVVAKWGRMPFWALIAPSNTASARVKSKVISERPKRANPTLFVSLFLSSSTVCVYVSVCVGGGSPGLCKAKARKHCTGR